MRNNKRVNDWVWRPVSVGDALKAALEKPITPKK